MLGQIRIYIIVLSLAVAGVLGSQRAAAQMWTTRLSVPLDSLTLEDDSLKYLYHRARIAFQFLPDDMSPILNEAPFDVVYKAENSHIKYEPTPDIYRDKFEKHHQNFYRLQSGLEAEKGMIYDNNSMEDIRREYAKNNPDKVQHTWSEIPEMYKEINEGRKINTNRDKELLTFAKKLGPEQKFDRNIRSLPSKKTGPWTFSGEENAQFSQLFLCNWTKGGESSVTLSFDLRAKAVYSKDKHNWESNATHKFGFTYTSVLGGRVSDDEISLTSKYGYQAVNKWYYSFQTQLKTQMFTNYEKTDTLKETPKSKLLSPGYWQLIFGMDYKVDNLNILLSPYTASITIVADTTTIDKSDYGITKDKHVKWENGFSVNANWKYRITTEITYTTTAEFFYQYERDGTRQFDWENVFDMQINRFLSTRFLLKIRYFNNESTKFQLKENFSVAFKFSF